MHFITVKFRYRLCFQNVFVKRLCGKKKLNKNMLSAKIYDNKVLEYKEENTRDDYNLVNENRAGSLNQ